MRKAFTLIEILIVVSLLGIVMISVTQLLAGVLTGSAKANASQMVKENGQFAISTIERSLRNASRVTTCISGVSGSINFVVSDQTGTNTIYIYSRVSNRLRQTVNGAASYLTGSELSVTSFSCAQSAGSPGQPPVYKISLIISKPSSIIGQNIASQTFETTVSLRTY